MGKFVPFQQRQKRPKVRRQVAPTPKPLMPVKRLQAEPAREPWQQDRGKGLPSAKRPVADVCPRCHGPLGLRQNTAGTVLCGQCNPQDVPGKTRLQVRIRQCDCTGRGKCRHAVQGVVHAGQGNLGGNAGGHAQGLKAASFAVVGSLWCDANAKWDPLVADAAYGHAIQAVLAYREGRHGDAMHQRSMVVDCKKALVQAAIDQGWPPGKRMAGATTDEKNAALWEAGLLNEWQATTAVPLRKGWQRPVPVDKSPPDMAVRKARLGLTKYQGT